MVKIVGTPYTSTLALEYIFILVDKQILYEFPIFEYM